MTEKEAKIWELLAKRESGEATGQELAELDALLSGETKMHIDRRLSILKNYWAGLQNVQETDMSEKLASLLSDMDLTDADNEPEARVLNTGRNKSFIHLTWWKVAAMFVVLAGIAVILTVLFTPKTIEIVAGKGMRKELTLPDGTKVHLNSDSKLVYSRKYLQSAKREVYLEGEAFFDVKHNAAHPFIIHTTYGVDVQDLGTEFNVRAYRQDSLMETTLLKGSVEVYMDSKADKKLLLYPKQKFVFYKNRNKKLYAKNKGTINGITIKSGTLSDDLFEIANIVPVVNKNGDSLIGETAWLQNQLVFNSETFSELAAQMSQWYNITFDIKDSSVAAYRFSGVFQGETLTEALDELKMIRPFTYSVADSVVNISK